MKGSKLRKATEQLSLTEILEKLPILLRRLKVKAVWTEIKPFY